MVANQLHSYGITVIVISAGMFVVAQTNLVLFKGWCNILIQMYVLCPERLKRYAQ